MFSTIFVTVFNILFYFGVPVLITLCAVDSKRKIKSIENTEYDDEV